MNHLTEQYLIFFSKSLTIFIFLFVLLMSFAASMASSKAKQQKKPRLKLLNKELHNTVTSNLKALSQIPLYKSLYKKIKKQSHKKKNKVLYVLDFNGDIEASETETLRHEIDLLLKIAQKSDKVIIRLNSRGGGVSGYGFATSQLNRIRQAGIDLTVSIDQVAASGGYMMAAIANRIIAAPFSTIGSIGVAVEMPNYYELLNKVGVKYLSFTAGKHKRSISPYTEQTAEGEEKTQESIDLIHTLFKDHVKQYRPEVDIEETAQGEIWPAIHAKEKGLVDEIKTSDCEIMEAMNDYLVMQIHTPKKQNMLKSITTKALQLLQNSSTYGNH